MNFSFVDHMRPFPGLAFFDVGHQMRVVHHLGHQQMRDVYQLRLRRQKISDDSSDSDDDFRKRI